MSWPILVWERIAGTVLVNRWIGRNVISALGSLTVLASILALALILRDWGFSQPQRFVLTIASFILLGLSGVVGIGLSIMPGDPLNLGRVFGTNQSPRNRREPRMDPQMSIAPLTLSLWRKRDTTMDLHGDVHSSALVAQRHNSAG